MKKEKTYLVAIVDAFNEEVKGRVFEQEINTNFIPRLRKKFKNKIKFLHRNTLFDSPTFEWSKPEVSYFDLIADAVKNRNIKDAKVVVILVNNSDDYLDEDNRAFLKKALKQKNIHVLSTANKAENCERMLDLGIQIKVYSKMSAGIQCMVSELADKTIKLLT